MSLRVKRENVLKNLAELTGTSSVGRPSNEEKEREEEEEKRTHEKKTQMAIGEIASAFEIPVDDIIPQPGEVVDYRQSLEKEKDSELRARLTKMKFENEGLKKWSNRVLKQLSDATRGDKVTIAAPPAGMLQQAGFSEDSEGMTKFLKAMMPYMMIKDLFKDDDGVGKGYIKFKSPDGTEYEYPAGSFPPGYSPFGDMQRKNEGSEEKIITVKIGENEIKGPPSLVNAMLPTIMVNTAKSGGDSGGSALQQVIELQKMMLEQRNASNDKEEKMISVIDEEGKPIEIPASIYPQYVMMQNVAKQNKIMLEHERAIRQRPQSSNEGATSTTYAAIAQMQDAMGRLAEMLNPDKVGEIAVKGLITKAAELEELRGLLGGRGEEDPEVMKKRIEEQELTKRAQMVEGTKLDRDREKTRQAELEAQKFDLMLRGANPNPNIGGLREVEEEERQPRTDEVYNKSAAINRAFLEELKAKREEEFIDEEEEEE